MIEQSSFELSVYQSSPHKETMNLFSFDRSKVALKSARTFTAAIAACTVFGLSSCSEDNAPGNTITENKPDQPFVHPIDFPAVIHPADNQPSAAKIELGRRLFYDKRLSLNSTHSCGTCHEADKGFALVSNVQSDKRGAKSRQAMGVINVAYNSAFLWDSSFTTLEEQVEGPFKSSHEFNQTPDSAVRKLTNIGDPIYTDLFTKSFGDQTITFERIAKAIATFERTFISGNSSFDRYNRGQTTAMTPQQINGLRLFMDTTETNCLHCHSDYNFSDGSMHSTGLEEHYSDGGLQTITGREEDNGKFRTPTLRNIRETGPYMHDGRFKTLIEVIRHYNEGGKGNRTQDPHIRKLHLTDGEMEDLRAFLEGLSDEQFLTRKDLKNPWLQ